MADRLDRHTDPFISKAPMCGASGFNPAEEARHG